MYICVMNVLNLSKHGLTALVFASLVLGSVQLYSLDVLEENFGDHIISGTFFLGLFVVLATYRIDWIGRQKINWISMILFLLNLSGLLIMLANPKNVMALWKPTVAAYILLCGFVFYLKINRKNWSAHLAKILLLITAVLFLFPLLIQTTDRAYYQVSWIFLISAGIFSLLQLVLPEKQR